MGVFKIYFLLFSVVLFGQKNTALSQNIKTVSFQNWVGGQEFSGGGTDIYIDFKELLSPNIVLVKMFFRGNEFKIEKTAETKYIARYSYRPELKIDPYGNREIVQKTEEITKPKYILNQNEAMIEYLFKKKKCVFKVKNVTEKEFLAYP